MDLWGHICLGVQGVNAGLPFFKELLFHLAFLSKVSPVFFLPFKPCDNVQKSSTKQDLICSFFEHCYLIRPN